MPQSGMPNREYVPVVSNSQSHFSARPAAPDPQSTGSTRLRVAGGLAAAVVLVDQLVKNWVLSTIGPDERVRIIGPVSLIRRFNKGAAFSFGNGSRLTAWFATVMVVVVAVAIVRHLLAPPPDSPVRVDRRWWVALGLICGGGIGNQVDRLFRSGGWNRGAVVDFVDIGFWPVFNVADAALTIGCTAVIVLSIFGDIRSKRQPKTSLKESL
jgi:signal peptidase II